MKGVLTPAIVQSLSGDHCPVCGSGRLKVFFEMLNVPVLCCEFSGSYDAARNCPRGNIKLAFCPVCSYIVNSAFEPALVEYTQAYENSLFFSPRFQEYARSIAELLVRLYSLREKDIVSIGEGKGEFLSLLCELGNNRGTGFDPSYVEQEKHRGVKDHIRFIQGLYSEQHANYSVDLIVCRHVLEHVYDPKSFLAKLRQIIGNRSNTRLFFEVPNALQTFRRLSAWDIIYEHYSYFTPTSLEIIFSSSGFRVCELTEEFEGQYLCVYAQPCSQGASQCDYQPTGEISRIEHDISAFAANYRDRVEKCRVKLEQMKEEGQRVVIWGAGSKGVAFLNTFSDSVVKYAIDINPRKQGRYVPGTGQEIVSPEFLKDYQPDVIMVMNSIYREEIQQVTKTLGVESELIDI